MTRASCTRKQTSAARSRPACPAYSRSATCARDRSSALPPPSARAPRWWPHFTPSSATPATQPGSPPTPGDHDVRRVRPCRRHSRRDHERARLRGVSKDRFAMAASAALPDLRQCRLLRRLAEPPRHQAFSPWETAVAIFLDNPVEVVNRLDSLGWKREELLEVVDAMVRARYNCTDNDPSGAAGWMAWKDGT